MSRALSVRGRPVITEFELFGTADQAWRGETAGWESKGPRQAGLTATSFARLRERLIERGQVEVDRDFLSGVFRIVAAADAPAEAVCCLVDPFCYVSHLSAMQHYGLTDRNPISLSLTTPHRKLWNALADRLMAEGAGPGGGGKPGGLKASAAVRLQRYGFRNTVRGRAVVRHETRHPGTAIQVRDTAIRISTIGRTFADTLLEPALCGGMTHVLDVWEAMAETYVEEIIDAIEGIDSPILKVRAGYILAERLGMAQARIDAWSALAARGGSRRLDPERPFDSRFSAKWMLSLNA